MTSRNSAALAETLADAWPSRARVYPRPFNRFKWDDSETWWLAPVPGPSTFQYSKVVVTSSPLLVGPNELFVGLYVEKGIGASLAEAGYYRADWVIGPTWSWHRIVGDLLTGAFRAPIAEVFRRTGEAVEVRVDAHVPVVEGSIRPPHDLLAYETTDGVLIQSSSPPVLNTEEGFLQASMQVRTLAELGDSLKSIPGSDSAWVNFYLGRTVQTAETEDPSALSAAQLATDLVSPFAPWVA